RRRLSAGSGREGRATLPGDASRSATRRGRVRILHAPRNIADQAGVAVRALRRLGHDAEVWEYDEHPFRFPVDRTIDTRSGDPAIWWRTFLEAIERFDVFHFHFGR